MADLQARVIITAVDQVSKQLGGMANKMQGFGKKVARVGTGMTAAGAAIAAPVLAAGGAAVAAGIDFEKAMLEWKKASDALETTEGWDKAHDAIFRLGRELPQSHTELAQIATQASKAGVGFEEFEGFVTLAAQAASAFDIPAKEAGELLAGIKEGLNLTNEEMQLHLGQMDLLENAYKTTGAHLADYLQQEYASVKTFGVSIQEYLALTTTIEKSGISSEKIARAMRAIGTELGAGINATKSQRSAWKMLEMDAKQVAKTMQEDGGIIKVLQKMKVGLDNLPAEERGPVLKAIVGKMGLSSLTNLIDKLDMVNEAMALTSDEAAAMNQLKASFDIGMEGLGQQLEMLKNAFGEIILKMSKAFMPYTKQAVAWVQKLTKALGENPQAMKWLVGGLTAIAGLGTGLMIAGVGITAIGVAISGLGAALGLISMPVLLAFAGAALAIWLAFENWDKLGPLVGKIGKWFGDWRKHVDEFWKIVKPAWEEMKAAALELGSAVGPALREMYDAASPLLEALEPLGAAIWDFAAAIGEMMGYDINSLESKFEPLKAVANVLAQIFREIAGLMTAITEMLKGEFDWSKLLPSVSIKKGSFADRALNLFRPTVAPSIVGADGKAVVQPPTKSAVDGKLPKLDLNLPTNSPLMKDGPVPVEGNVKIKDDVPMKVDGQIDARITVGVEPGAKITQKGFTASGRNVGTTVITPGVGRTGRSDLDIGAAGP